MEHEVIHHSELSRFHNEYYLRNRPVVIRGLSERGLEIFKWSTEYFARIMGTKQVPVIGTTNGFLSYERNLIDMTFNEFSEAAFDPERRSGLRYYYKNPTTLLPAGHDDSMEITELAPYMRKTVSKSLWISGSGLTVGLHFDPADNLNFQLRGSKTFHLYPPGTRRYYPAPLLSETALMSSVYQEGPNPDLKRFPRFNPGSALRIELQQGDLLYLPAYWWHLVESTGEENVNLNFFWIPRLTKQLSNVNQALRGWTQAAARLVKYGHIQSAPPAKSRSLSSTPAI